MNGSTSLRNNMGMGGAPRRPGNEKGMAGNLALLDHLQYDRRSFARLFLADQPL